MVRQFLLLILLGFVSLILIPTSTLSATIHVPSDVPTIQSALDLAATGDTVLVASGTYSDCTHPSSFNEPSCFLLKSDVVLRSATGLPQTTIIDAAGLGRATVTYGITNARVEGFTFKNGAAVGGGGAAYIGPYSTVEFTDCSFVENSSGGGGALVFDTATSSLLRCTFTSNATTGYGGAVVSQDAHVSFIECTFRENTSVAVGAVHVTYGSPATPAYFKSCIFENNIATAIGYCGGLSISNGFANLQDCTFISGSWSQLEIGSQSDVVLEGCVFLAASVFSIIGGHSLTIEGCTIANSLEHGMLIETDVANVSIENTIVSGCAAAGIICYSEEPPQIACSNVYGNGSGDWVGCLEPALGSDGNISADPLFCDSANGDLHISGWSPCAPPHSGGCGLIGALDIECEPYSGLRDLGPLSSVPGASTGCAWVDVDSDSDLDIHVLRDQDGADIIYRNDGPGGFVPISSGSLADLGRGQGMDWGDYNNDGLLDVYIVNSSTANHLYRNLGAGNFTDVTAAPLNYGYFDQGATWVDYDRDGYLDVYLTTHFDVNHLYRNLGNGTFQETTPSALAIPLKCGNSAWGDYDNDGDSDVFICVQDGPDVLARNEGNGTFVNVPSPPLSDSGLAQGAAWGDYDNDFDLDLYVCAFGQENKLFRNDGGAFTNVAAGDLADVGNAQSGTWADYDNDRDLDLVLTNFGQPNLLFRNDAGVFVQIGLAAVPDSESSLGAAWGDYDQDGDLDMLIANYGSPDRLYRNDLPNENNWLEVTLEGTTSNRSAIGARITAVDLTSGVSQIREHGSNHGLWSCNQPGEHFGLGSTDRLDFLIIRWPSGSIEYFSDLPANQRFHIIEGAGIVGAQVGQSADARVVVRPNPFRKSTEILWSGIDRGRAKLDLYDVQGRLVRSLAGDLPGTIQWDGQDASGRTVPNGVYFYRIESGQRAETGKLIRVR